jgi:hypothetical protein
MAGPRKVTVTLEPQLDDYVREQMKQRALSSPGEFIETVLREHLESDEARREMERQLQKGLDDIDAGRVTSINEAFDNVYAERALKHRAG